MVQERELGTVLRYCPKCGAAALHPRGVKLWHCSECGFELYLNVAAAVAALIFDAEGRLLVTVRAKEPSKGMWDLPGGFVDPAESVEEALRREIAEELGLEIVSMRFVSSHPNTYEYMGIRYATVDLGFVCEVADLKRLAPEASEVAEILFVPLQEVEVDRLGFSSLARIVEDYRNGVV